MPYDKLFGYNLLQICHNAALLANSNYYGIEYSGQCWINQNSILTLYGLQLNDVSCAQIDGYTSVGYNSFTPMIGSGYTLSAYSISNVINYSVMVIIGIEYFK